MQVRNDTLTHERGSLDNVQHFFKVVLQQSQFEAVLGGIEGNGTWSRGSVKTVDGLSLDASQIYRVVECTDDTVVSVKSVNPLINHLGDEVLTLVGGSI